MRLDQFVSQATGMSRKDAQRCIRNKHIIASGHVITKAATHINPADEVLLDFEAITLPGQIYLMLNKPAGVVSATEDASQLTVIGLIDHPHRHTLHIVGRLDKDTTGLLLLTNDGDWSHRITSPRYHIPKTYLATLAEPLSNAAIAQLQQGVMLKGEQQATLPAEVAVLTDTAQPQARLTIREGKYHQVKRMFAAVGNHVLALHRERIGDWILPEDLAAGEWCVLDNAGSETE